MIHNPQSNTAKYSEGYSGTQSHCTILGNNETNVMQTYKNHGTVGHVPVIPTIHFVPLCPHPSIFKFRLPTFPCTCELLNSSHISSCPFKDYCFLKSSILGHRKSRWRLMKSLTLLFREQSKK